MICCVLNSIIMFSNKNIIKCYKDNLVICYHSLFYIGVLGSVKAIKPLAVDEWFFI